MNKSAMILSLVFFVLLFAVLTICADPEFRLAAIFPIAGIAVLMLLLKDQKPR